MLIYTVGLPAYNARMFSAENLGTDRSLSSENVGDIGIALEEAKIEANRFLDAPIWKDDDEEHVKARLRWFEHGEREALFAALYIKTYGSPQAVHSDASLSEIMLGFILHDIGKVEAAPHQVWDLMPQDLMPEDKEAMRRHVTVGDEIIARYEKWSGEAVAPVVLDIVLFHHEKLDGSSKQCGLKSRDIGFFSRLAVCIDQIVGRCEDRSYHEYNYTLRESFNEVYKTAGVQYDQEILDNLFGLFSAGRHLAVEGCGWIGKWADDVDNLG